MRTLALLLALLPAVAGAEEHKLDLLPGDKLMAMPPLLRGSDVALIESIPDGKMKQVTLMTLVAAPPQVVHDVVADLEHYPEFIHNMTRATVTKNPDGSVDIAWRVSLVVSGFESIFRYRFNADGSIDIEGIDKNDDGVYRWEFYPVPGGTVLVFYGYADIRHANRYVRSVLAKLPSMEHGMAVSAQMVWLRSVKQRAEALTGNRPWPAIDPRQKGPGFNFLLDRGRVAVMRSLPNGRLADISLLDRIAADREKIEATILAPAAYASFMEGVDRSEELSRGDDGIQFRAEISLPLISWNTKFSMHRATSGAIELVGIDGDLRTMHVRWDLTPLSDGKTLMVQRAIVPLGPSSIVLRGLFLQEPLFEHGTSVSFDLVLATGVRARAEGKR